MFVVETLADGVAFDDLVTHVGAIGEWNPEKDEVAVVEGNVKAVRI